MLINLGKYQKKDLYMGYPVEGTPETHTRGGTSSADAKGVDFSSPISRSLKFSMIVVEWLIIHLFLPFILTHQSLHFFPSKTLKRQNFAFFLLQINQIYWILPTLPTPCLAPYLYLVSSISECKTTSALHNIIFQYGELYCILHVSAIFVPQITYL